MVKHEFIKKVALTLEFSLKMAQDWLEELHPENQEQRSRLEEYMHTITELLKEVESITTELREETVEQVGEVVENVLEEKA